jgi:dCMP deaminase
MNDTQRQWMRRVYLAGQSSHDPHTHIGAVIVSPDGRISALGSNQFPYAVHQTAPRLERPAKYQFIEHAERNAIYRCAWTGYSTNGATMYTDGFACVECARAIICAGITTVVSHQAAIDQMKLTGRWSESVQTGIQIMTEAGVKLVTVEGKVLDPADQGVLYDGKVWYP